MTSPFAYPRLDPTDPAAARRRVPALFDLDRARRLWGPWASLDDDASAHIVPRHAAVIRSAVATLPADDPLARPWAQAHATGPFRRFTLDQLALAEPLDDSTASDPVIAAFQRERRDADPRATLRRLQLVAAVGALAADPLPSEQRGGADDSLYGSPIGEHLLYEIERFERARDPEGARESPVLERLAVSAVEPVTRLLAAKNLANYLILDFGVPEAARPWLHRGAALYDELRARSEPWFAHTMIVHFERLVALYWAVSGRIDEARRSLDRAFGSLERAAEDLRGDALPAYYVAEARSFLLGVAVRLQARSGGTFDGVAELVEALDREEPFNPETRMAVAEICAASGDLPSAAEQYEQAAQGGGVTATKAAYRGYEIRRRLGAHDGIERALTLLTEVDRFADVDALIARA
ncbi:hypothetical protein [Streptomyces sp. AC495_CC817]|uniref:hypothetical protein n=1 Tax=Streptomyces sp. AC495_CC817 TaxID=2823900 RepID=UPI001C2596B4|nr:hypothetical protein [Streptomyces sp. AC495_CC817]